MTSAAAGCLPVHFRPAVALIVGNYSDRRRARAKRNQPKIERSGPNNLLVPFQAGQGGAFGLDRAVGRSRVVLNLTRLAVHRWPISTAR